MIWNRPKSSAVPTGTKLVGLDLTASRARAVAAAAGRVRSIPLAPPAETLPLFVSLERRHPEVGRAGVALCRKLPHLVCANFLPALGQPKEWRNGRLVLTPDTALLATFEAIRSPVLAEGSAVGLALPGYLTAVQVKMVVGIAAKAKLPVAVTAPAALAIAAHRANAVLAAKETAADPKPEWVVPIRSGPGGPGVVVILDADEFALTATAVQVGPNDVRPVASGVWPRAGARAWKDRLLDGLSDRCVRLCRRDPRDSADAEQALFDQLDPALDAARKGESVTLTVRSAHWYQDLPLTPADLDALCAGPAKLAADGLREVTANLPAPPRAVWLTAAAGRLPGLAAAAYANSAEQTAVAVLPPAAAAEAAASLLARGLTGHLDSAIPLEQPAAASRTAKAKPSS